MMTTYTYPKSWDEPYTPPENLQEPLRSAMIKSCAHLLTLSRDQKQAMYIAQMESFIRAMTTPCEHGVLDFEQCVECRSEPATPPKVETTNKIYCSEDGCYRTEDCGPFCRNSNER